MVSMIWTSGEAGLVWRRSPEDGAEEATQVPRSTSTSQVWEERLKRHRRPMLSIQIVTGYPSHLFKEVEQASAVLQTAETPPPGRGGISVWFIEEW